MTEENRETESEALEEQEERSLQLLLEDIERRAEAAEYPRYSRGRRMLLFFGGPFWLLAIPLLVWLGAPGSVTLAAALLPLLLAAIATYRPR